MPLTDELERLGALHGKGLLIFRHWGTFIGDSIFCIKGVWCFIVVLTIACQSLDHHHL